MFYELNRKTLNLFIAQNPSTGDFDVVFEVDGKKLYAHKSKLTGVSNTFSAMFSDRWTSPNQPIKLETYPFDVFKEFVTFIYSGGCKLDHDNIYTMADIAEFYDVEVFKRVCENFLLKVVLGPDNIFQMIELAYKYSMENLKKSVLQYVSKNISIFIKSEQFINLPKTIVCDVVESCQFSLRQEELFEMTIDQLSLVLIVKKMDYADFVNGMDMSNYKEYIDAFQKQYRFSTETMTILSNESHPCLNNLAVLMKDTETIEVVNDVVVQIIPLTNLEIMKAIQNFDTFIIVTSEATTELYDVRNQAEDDGKNGFIFTYKEVDEDLVATEMGRHLLARINHYI